MRFDPISLLRFFAVAALVILQTAPWFSIVGVRPQLLLVVLLVAALGAPERSALGFWIVIGLLQDLLSGSRFGMTTVFFFLAGVTVSFLSHQFMAQTTTATAAAAAGITILETLYVTLVRAISGPEYAGDAFPRGFLSLLLAQVVFSVLLFAAGRRVPLLGELLWGERHGS